VPPALATIRLGNTTGAACALGDLGVSEPLKGLALKQARDPMVYGLTTDKRLVSVKASAPNAIVATVSVSGVPAGESLIGIDVRPSDGKLYALSFAGKLYTVDT